MLGGEPSTNGADARSFVFSATMSSEALEVWVHWYEETKDDQRFHMNRIASKTLNDLSALIEMRRILHNIMEWCAVSRTQQQEELHQLIHDYARRQLKETQEVAGAVKAEHSKKRRLNRE